MFLGVNLVAQELSEKEMIGFGCWSSGEQTKQVDQGFQLLSTGNIDKLRKNLNKSNSAKQFFAVIVLTKLDSAGTISLTSNELERISKIHYSAKKVAFCSGCITFYDSTLSDALNRESEIYKTSNYWINRTLQELNYLQTND